VISNIPVRRNRNGSSDRNFRNIWQNGKHPTFPLKVTEQFPYLRSFHTWRIYQNPLHGYLSRRGTFLGLRKIFSHDRQNIENCLKKSLVSTSSSMYQWAFNAFEIILFAEELRLKLSKYLSKSHNFTNLFLWRPHFSTLFHHCNFNIKYRSNWTRDERTRAAKSRLFRSGRSLHVYGKRRINSLWSCSRKKELDRNSYPSLVFTQLKKYVFLSLKCCTFSPKHLTEAKSVRKSRNECWMTRFWKGESLKGGISKMGNLEGGISKMGNL